MPSTSAGRRSARSPFGAYDADYNQVQDGLAPDAGQRIIVLLPDGPSQADHNIFLGVGGRDVVDLPQLNMMIGTLSSATAQTALRAQLGARALLIGADQRFDASAVSLSRRSSGAVAAGPLNVPWRTDAVAPAATVNVTVAVLDTGVDASHPTLNNKIVASYDALAPGNFPDDIVGQGTHVAAIIAGETRSGAEPFEGVAPDANLAPVRIGTTDQWQLSDFLRGIDWVIQQRSSRQIAVANNSITVPGIQNPFWTVALRKLAQQGVLVVSAAGNNGDTVVGAPADDPAIITVGATNARADVLDDSSHGVPYMNVIKPDLLAPGSNIYSAKAGSTGYENRSGTEMAAPIVAGVAAQLIMRNAVPANGDEDDDGIPDNDPWNGYDDNRDDILDSDLGPWNPSAANLRTLKSLLLMSTADVPTPAAAAASSTLATKTGATKTTTSGFGVRSSGHGGCAGPRLLCHGRRHVHRRNGRDSVWIGGSTCTRAVTTAWR
ncbi:MAG: S8 family serine peptidase [Caldilineaceae bacterium]